MANHKQALKRIKQNEKRRLRNKAVRTRVKNVTKSFEDEVSAPGSNRRSLSLSVTFSLLE